MALENDAEQYEEEEFDIEKTQGVDMLQGLLRKASRVPIRGRRKVMNSYAKKHAFQATPSYNEPDILQASATKSEIFQAPPSDLKPDIFQAAALNQNQNPFQESLLDTKPDITWRSSSGMKPDNFQVKPSAVKEDIFQAPASNLKHIFQTTPSYLKSDISLSKPSNLNSNPFLATPLDSKPDIFSALPPKSQTPNIFQVTGLGTKADIFQDPPLDLKPNVFPAVPTNPKKDLFQMTPPNHIVDPFQAMPLDPKPDNFWPSSSNVNPDIFQPATSNLELSSLNLKPDICQVTSSNIKQEIFQPTTFSLNANIYQASPSEMKSSIVQSTPFSSKSEITKVAFSNQNINPFQTSALDPKTEISFATSSKQKPEIFHKTPSDLKDSFQPIPSDLKSDIFNASFSDGTEDTFQAKVLDMEPDAFKVMSHDKQQNPLKTTRYDLKKDLFKATDSDLEDDIFRIPTPDLKKGIFDDSPTYTKQDSKSKATEEGDYPVYENIFLIGQEKCVEDWPEDSPELNPDSKAPHKFKLRRESFMEKENGKDLDDNRHEMDGKLKKGRRFNVTFGHRSSKTKHEDPHMEQRKSKEKYMDETKGGDLPTNGKSSKENYVDDGNFHTKGCKEYLNDEDFPINYKGFKDYHLEDGDIFTSHGGSKKYPNMTTWGNVSKSRRDRKLHDECLAAKPELQKESSGDSEQYDPTQHKKGKKFKFGFAHHRSSKETDADMTKCSDASLTHRDSKNILELEEMLPGATCANYHLSEAAEAEWLSAQQDMKRCSHLEDDWVVEKEKDADTDSLMEWWNSVEQWDKFPVNTKEDLTEEEEARILLMLANKVQKGIRVFNKVFTEQAEGLYQHIVTLGAIADNTCNVHKKAKIANITGGTTTAVGGVAAITGLALAPVTFGASLIVTAVGVGVATAGGLTSASAAISDNINVSMDRKKVEHVVEDYEAKMADISKCLKFISMGLEKMRVYSKKRTTWIFHRDWETRRAAQIASLGEEEVAQASRVVNMIYGVLGSLFQGMNSFYRVNDTREMKKNAKKEFAGKVRDVAQHLQDGLIELNIIREQLQDAIGYI